MKTTTSPGKTGGNFYGLGTYLGLAGALLAMIALFSVLSDHFLSYDTFSTLANQIPDLMVLAVGMTFILIIGGIDLSVGSVLALAASAVSVAILGWGWSVLPAALLGMGCAALAGTITGSITVAWRIPSFIVSLGVLEMARGVAYQMTGSRTAYIGDSFAWLSNPIAFGWPRPQLPPFIFDMATSAAARGEIELHRRAGTPLPPGWGIDQQGEPSTDAASVLQGAMLTFGGHKGSALAAMVELIAGPLIGDMTSKESLAYDRQTGSSPYGGELIIAMDPDRFLGADKALHLARAEALFADMSEQGARIPGERRYQRRQYSEQHGISLPQTLYDEIVALCH